ncbi:MAG: hypothetical protein HXL50_07270 [Solobacterium sp.]|nr:hypothetical protein [Solobacterium sp.]
MKAKKWLTIITLIISFLSFVAATVIGKNSNCIYYDVSLALLGSAVLGFIMSITEYYVERRKAMEEFWIQATNILIELRKIQHLDLDAPTDLIIKVFGEKRSNEWNQMFSSLSEDIEIQHKAKDNLISWYEENIPLPFDDDTDVEKELEKLYQSKMISYQESFGRCMNSYQLASSVELGALDNAYGNLDFIFANKCIREKAYDFIFDKIRNIVIQFKKETYHFNLLKEGKGNFPVCATKVLDLDKEYFLSEEETEHGYLHTLVYQNVFDDIQASLEKFRCKIYRTKYDEPKREPISGKMLYFGDEEDKDQE